METTHRLLKVVRFLRQEIDGEMQLQQLELLLTVALQEGITSPELIESLHVSNAAVSRNLKIYSRYSDKGEEKGHGLFELKPDMFERRRLAVFLTTRGKEVISNIEKRLT